MRDRALEMDSHHEVIGSEVTWPLGFGVPVEEAEEEGEGDAAEICVWRKSILSLSNHGGG